MPLCQQLSTAQTPAPAQYCSHIVNCHKFARVGIMGERWEVKGYCFVFGREVKIAFTRLVKCMKNIDNFCSPLNKLCSIIKMLPILDNMCCSTKHWLMLRPSKNGVYLSRRGPNKYLLWLFQLWCVCMKCNAVKAVSMLHQVLVAGQCSVNTVCSKKVIQSSDIFWHFRQS